MARQRDKALEILDRLQDRAKRQYVLPYAFARLHVGLGDQDKAIEALWRDYDERAGSHELLWLKVSRCSTLCVPTPRFIALLRKIGLELPDRSAPIVVSSRSVVPSARGRGSGRSNPEDH
jgi:hypothetical protein